MGSVQTEHDVDDNLKEKNDAAEQEEEEDDEENQDAKDDDGSSHSDGDYNCDDDGDEVIACYNYTWPPTPLHDPGGQGQADNDVVFEVEEDNIEAPPPLPSSVDVEMANQEPNVEDDHDGPPPGWQSWPLPTPLSLTATVQSDTKMISNVQNEEDEDEDEGPPPGWQSIPPQQTPAQFLPPPSSEVVSDIKMISNNIQNEEDEYEDEDKDEGPPPGWQSIPPRQTPAQLLLRPSSEVTSDAKMISNVQNDDDEDEDEGPPPGWQSIPPRQMPAQLLLPPSSEVAPDVQMRSNQQDVKDEDEDEGPPPGWQSIPPKQQKSFSLTPSPLASTISSDIETKNKQEHPEHKEEGPAPEQRSMPPSQTLQPTAPQSQRASAAVAPSEKAQMVCGSCQQLLCYQRGAKYAQCSCCQTVNLVLEAHQVGQVKCGGCSVLLMYPFGAQSVKCSSCRFVTDIGAHNRRPPLSLQQSRRPTLKSVS